jgi:hypothetical protein
MRKPDQPSNAENLEEVADWGRLLFGYFFLAKQEKVTSRRATPDKLCTPPVENTSQRSPDAIRDSTSRFRLRNHYAVRLT